MNRANATRGRRRTLGAFLPFTVTVVEIVVFVLVAGWIGFGYAVLLAIGTSLLGLWVMRRAGFHAWRSLRSVAIQAGLPITADAAGTGGRTHQERIADAGVTLLAGTVLLMPGFVSDAAALFLLVPPVRKSVGRRLAAAALRTFPPRGPRMRGGSGGSDVIEGEVVKQDGVTDPELPDASQQDEG